MSNTYNTGLVDFIDNVLYPVEAFAKMCIDSNDNLFIPNLPKAGLNEVGVVAGALVALSKIQLREVAEKLQSNVGVVEITRENTGLNHGKVFHVGMGDKQE